MKFKFFEKMNCAHVWKKDVTYHQLNKDDDKVLWLCEKCAKRMERNRWEPPKHVIADKWA